MEIELSKDWGWREVLDHGMKVVGQQECQLSLGMKKNEDRLRVKESLEKAVADGELELKNLEEERKQSQKEERALLEKKAAGEERVGYLKSLLGQETREEIQDCLRPVSYTHLDVYKRQLSINRYLSCILPLKVHGRIREGML